MKILNHLSRINHDVNVGSHILLDDGLIDLEVTDIDRDANEIVTVVKTKAS